MKQFLESYSAKIVESGVTLVEGIKPALQLNIPDIAEYNNVTFDLATGVTDQERVLSPIDGAKFLILEYDKDITIKLNANSNTAIVLNTYGTPAAGKFFIMSAATTSVFFSNASGSVAKIKMFYGY